MNFINLLIICLGVWGAVEIWHHGEIFARSRLYFKQQVDSKTILYWPSKLMTCPFCLSFWVSLLFCVLYNYLYYFILAVAVSRVSNVLNDVFKSRMMCYTPTPSDQELTTEQMESLQKEENDKSHTESN